jgi:hypothetical protein
MQMIINRDERQVISVEKVIASFTYALVSFEASLSLQKGIPSLEQLYQISSTVLQTDQI